MSIGINNIEQSVNFGFSSTVESAIGMERLFSSVLDYGKIVMLLLDLFLLNLCFFCTGWLLLGIERTMSITYCCGMIYFSLLWVFLSYLRGIHKDLLLIDAVVIFKALAKVFFVFTVCSWFFVLILLDGFSNMSLFIFFVSLFYCFFGGALVGNRLILLGIRKHFKDKIRRKKNIFIIGDGSSCELLESYIQENQCDLRLCGFFSDGFEKTGDRTEKTDAARSWNALFKEGDLPHPDGREFVQASGPAGELLEDSSAYGVEVGVYRSDETAPTYAVTAGEALREQDAIKLNDALWAGDDGPLAGPSARVSNEAAGFKERTKLKVVQGRVLDCVKYFGKMPIDEIYCSMQCMEEKIARYLIREADSHMIRIKFLPDFYQIFRRRSTINYMGAVPVLSIRQEPLTFDSNVIIKRVFDICFSLFVIVFILSWLTPVIGLLIKLGSKGPVFFKQDRSGINNKPFKVYKFRSMRMVRDIGEDRQAVKNDVRLTKLGAFLRRSSLDELPQFWNVLLGDMTVVGPRPHMLAHTDKFSREVDTYMVRHFVKPGITGWAQDNGCRGETRTVEAIEERVRHDVWYIENWSLMLDLKIIFLTVWNVFLGEENAY